MGSVGAGEVSVVVVVDTYCPISDAVSRAIRDRSDLDLVGTASGSLIGFGLIRCARPRVALVDVQMGGAEEGFAVAHAVSERRLPTRVLMHSEYSNPTVIEAALRAGATGLITKDATSSEIAQAILNARGSPTLVASVSQPALLDSKRTEIEGLLQPGFELSRREAETLGLTGEGLGAKQIAWRLGVSENTVRTFLKRAYCKLGASNAAAAVAEARRQGLLK